MCRVYFVMMMRKERRGAGGGSLFLSYTFHINTCVFIIQVLPHSANINKIIIIMKILWTTSQSVTVRTMFLTLFCNFSF